MIPWIEIATAPRQVPLHRGTGDSKAPPAVLRDALYRKPQARRNNSIPDTMATAQSLIDPAARARPPRRSVGVPGVLLLAALVLAALVLSGCAGVQPQPVPERITRPPTGDLQLAEVRGAPERFLGSPVRWGGTVIEVERDAAGNARVQVLERRLDGEGRPIPGSASDGRFLILAAPDVDPDLYPRGAELTVAGTVREQQSVRIGDRSVAVPRVQVEVFQRWEPVWQASPYDDPYYYPYPYPYPWYGPPWYGPRVRFGVGIGHQPYPGWYGGHGLPPWWW